MTHSVQTMIDSAIKSLQISCVALCMTANVCAQNQPKNTNEPSSPAVSPRKTESFPRRVTVGLSGEQTMQLAEFPLDIAQESGIMVPVKYKGKTYTFLLDSGSTITVVDKSLLPLLGEKIRSATMEPSVGNWIVADLYPPMDEAMVGPLSLEGCGPVAVQDFEPMTKVSKVPCDGVLGMNFISKYLWVLSWDDKKLGVCETLATPGTQPLNVENEKKYSTGRIPILLGGCKTNAVLDTGYGSVIGLDEDTFDSMEKSGNIANVTSIEMASGHGVSFEKVGFLDEFRMPRADAVDVFEEVLVLRSNEIRLGLPFIKAYLMVWDVPDETITLIPRSIIRELRKKQGLPDIKAPPLVPEPKTIAIPRPSLPD